MNLKAPAPLYSLCCGARPHGSVRTHPHGLQAGFCEACRRYTVFGQRGPGGVLVIGDLKGCATMATAPARQVPPAPAPPAQSILAAYLWLSLATCIGLGALLSGGLAGWRGLAAWGMLVASGALAWHALSQRVERACKGFGEVVGGGGGRGAHGGNSTI